MAAEQAGRRRAARRERQQVLLRLDPAVREALARWAQGEEHGRGAG
ncbi:hypothetical protein [Mobilicoccus massiliensis]|nr:hypothetical protein [Mobilicoccus massiliensis]